MKRAFLNWLYDWRVCFDSGEIGIATIMIKLITFGFFHCYDERNIINVDNEIFSILDAVNSGEIHITRCNKYSITCNGYEFWIANWAYGLTIKTKNGITLYIEPIHYFEYKKAVEKMLSHSLGRQK